MNENIENSRAILDAMRDRDMLKSGKTLEDIYLKNRPQFQTNRKNDQNFDDFALTKEDQEIFKQEEKNNTVKTLQLAKSYF